MEIALDALEATVDEMAESSDGDSYSRGIIAGLEIAIDAIKRGMARDALTVSATVR